MEYQVNLGDATVDVAAVRAALCDVDPAADVRFDADDRALLINAEVEPEQLVDALGRAGYHVAQAKKEHVSGGSTCCGGCGG